MSDMDGHHDRVRRRAFLAASAASAATAASATGFSARGAEPKPAPTQADPIGYCSPLSVTAGELVRVHVSSPTGMFDASVERIGGKRKTVWSRRGIAGSEQGVPCDAWATGCGWPVAVEFPVDAAWPSGVYEVVLSPAGEPPPEKRPYPACFVVRAAASASPAPILLQLATNTDAAYNNFGGYSLYSYNGRFKVQGTRVSFSRPAPWGMLRAYEATFIAWAELNGYRLDYATNNDLEFHPEVLAGRRLMLSVGHDEYWSRPMRDTVMAFVARGGNAAFFSGNTCCWQVRTEADGLVCFKQNFREDPAYVREGPNPTLTTLWSHPLVGDPENTMTNVGVLGGGFHKSHGILMDGSGAFTVERPDHWVFAGTGLARGAEFGGERTIVGYECDGCEFTRVDGLPVPTGRDGTPKNFEILATAPASWGHESTILWWDAFPREEMGHACLGLSVRSPGGTVFTAGTTDWAHGLAAPADPLVDRITRNVLDRLSMG